MGGVWECRYSTPAAASVAMLSRRRRPATDASDRWPGGPGAVAEGGRKVGGRCHEGDNKVGRGWEEGDKVAARRWRGGRMKVERW